MPGLSWVRPWLKGLGGGCAVLLTANGAVAGRVEAWFPSGQATCFVRRYDARHLDMNPRQSVTYLAVSRMAKGGVESDGRVVLRLEAEVRGKRERFEGSIYCKAEGVGSRCHVEGDGGKLLLRMDNGRLRVEPSDKGIGLEGSVFISFGAAGSDDRVLLLDKIDDARACTPGRAVE